MWKMVLAALAACTLAPAFAATDEYERGMETMWEVLWHQSGVPTRVARWEQDLRVRVRGIDVDKHGEFTLRAVREVAGESGVKMTDVSNQAGSAANVDIEIVADSALEKREPCVTKISFKGDAIVSATMQMRTGDVRRCAYHELMHVMGLRGHPAGKTVLSYFPVKTDGLLPLDRAMLRAWYSPRVQQGMTPFEVLPVLAEAVPGAGSGATAVKSRERFLLRTVDQMRAFAEGHGDAPAILRRSGKTTDDGLNHGRSEMGYFLGVAYHQGACVHKDAEQSTQWLQRAASKGNRAAIARMAAGPG